MTNIAILGFGVVGGGVADLITKNSSEVARLGGDEINIKYILDLRDFPDSPFADKVVHDYNIILNDESVSTVIEVMGGSHPAYEFTIEAPSRKKNVITSNKEVVANYGDEFLALARKNNVSYRFEAAVGGGIPVISPMISCIGQNKITEVRGILNGTTNYILTKMFSFGDSFETALKDAQERGYAERNPDADILGTDAARKIVILSALVTGKLADVTKIYTEGIIGIRAADVVAAEKLGASIKLLGRCVTTEDEPFIMVSPFILKNDYALSGVSGVYNAVEVVGEPLGNVMFYGKGAGAGATASAVVGDLMQTINYAGLALPKFEKCDEVKDFALFKAKRYLAFDKEAEKAVRKVFADALYLDTDECSLITEEITEAELSKLLAKVARDGFEPLSSIRIL